MISVKLISVALKTAVHIKKAGLLRILPGTFALSQGYCSWWLDFFNGLYSRFRLPPDFLQPFCILASLSRSYCHSRIAWISSTVKSGLTRGLGILCIIVFSFNRVNKRIINLTKIESYRIFRLFALQLLNHNKKWRIGEYSVKNLKKAGLLQTIPGAFALPSLLSPCFG